MQVKAASAVIRVSDTDLRRPDTADPALPGPRAVLIRLCAAGFVASFSYAICRTPLLPLLARELGAGPARIGFVMGASTLTGISHLWSRRVGGAVRYCTSLEARDVAQYVLHGAGRRTGARGVAFTMAAAFAVASKTGGTDGVPRAA